MVGGIVGLAARAGGRRYEIRILETFRRLTAFAGVSMEAAVHLLRRYSLNKLAMHNPLMPLASLVEAWSLESIMAERTRAGLVIRRCLRQSTAATT